VIAHWQTNVKAKVKFGMSKFIQDHSGNHYLMEIHKDIKFENCLAVFNKLSQLRHRILLRQENKFDIRLPFCVEAVIHPTTLDTNDVWKNPIVSTQDCFNSAGWELRVSPDCGPLVSILYLRNGEIANDERIFTGMKEDINVGWHHVAFQINQEKMISLWLDGKKTTQWNIDADEFLHSSLPLTIGSNATYYQWEDRHFKGYIASVRISNAFLEPHEFLLTPKKDDSSTMKSALNV